MASVMLGRTACPECGFAAAHVKKSEKCHYRYCPECGSQHYAKSPRQVADLLAKTRQEGAATATGPSATGGEKPAPKVDAVPADTATAKATPEKVDAATVAVAPLRHGLGLFI